MTRKAVAAFLPHALPRIPDRHLYWVRAAWFAIFGFALLAQLAATFFVLRDTYSVKPVFASIGLSSGWDDAGHPAVDPLEPISGIAGNSYIVAINGKAVASNASNETLSHLIRDQHGAVVRITFHAPNGAVAEHALRRSDHYQREAAARDPVSTNTRMALRFIASGLGSIVLLVSAVLLFRRRADDPVAMLFSIAFLCMTITNDPPLMMWIGLQISEFNDIIASLWWVLVVIAISAFPDGRFQPGWLRWSLIIAPIIGIILAIDAISSTVMIVLSATPLAIGLFALILRYRRLEPGIGRQQIKWAAFGFAIGFLLLISALIIVEYPDWEKMTIVDRRWMQLTVISMFSLSFAVIPLGLLVALLRYRLWEADTVISRSAAYAFVTMLVGFIWAATSDLVKELVASLLGQHNATVATMLSALIAAIIFGPTQSIVLGWTKQRFARATEKLRALPARLEHWRNTESAPEIGMRTLAIITEGIHAQNAALLALTPTGRAIVALRDVANAEELILPGHVPHDDPKFPIVLPLEDIDGEVGLLLLGPRDDGNRYNRDERDALLDLSGPLAAAIRLARSRTQREESMHRMISAVEERLSRLEGPGEPRTAS